MTRGLTIAITGGARGIGRATAMLCAEQGARVAIGDLDGVAAHHASAEIGAAARAYTVDVARGDAFASFLGAVERDLGPLDVLVNNAGIMPIRTFVGEDERVTRRIIDVNVRGTMTGTKLALQRMLPRRRGHIINVASVAGKQASSGLATYCASKFAIVGFCEALQLELHNSGVQITCVVPGVVSTELAAGIGGPSFMKIEPETVARAIVGAISCPRAEVFVPRPVGPAMRALGLVPARARAALIRATRMDRPVAGAEHHVDRAAYDARACTFGEPVKGATR